MAHLLLEGSSPTAADREVVKALQLLQDITFRSALREVSHAGIGAYSALKKLYQQVTQAVNLHTLFHTPGSKAWSIYQQAYHSAFPELVGINFFPGIRPASDFPNRGDLKMSHGYLAFDFTIVFGAGDNQAQREAGRLAEPGYYRIYVGQEYARMEGIRYHTPLVPQKASCAELIESEWHADNEIFHEKNWYFTAADSISIVEGKCAYPCRIVTRWGLLPTALDETANDVVRTLFKKPVAREDLLRQMDLYLVRTAGNIGLYRGNSLGRSEETPNAVETYLLCSEVAEFIKTTLQPSSILPLYDEKLISQRLGWREDRSVSWEQPDPRIDLNHLRWVDQMVQEETTAAAVHDQ